MYLFHEIPREARAEVIRQSFRVLRPGGIFVLADSCQLGDRPTHDSTMGNFGRFNEPHYVDYVEHDLGKACHPVMTSDARPLVWKSVNQSISRYVVAVTL